MPPYQVRLTDDRERPLDIQGLNWRRFLPLPRPEEVMAVRMDQSFAIHVGRPHGFSQYGGPGDWLVCLPGGGLTVMRDDKDRQAPVSRDMSMQENYEPQDGDWCVSCRSFIDYNQEGQLGGSLEDEGPFCATCYAVLIEGAEAQAAGDQEPEA